MRVEYHRNSKPVDHAKADISKICMPIPVWDSSPSPSLPIGCVLVHWEAQKAISQINGRRRART